LLNSSRFHLKKDLEATLINAGVSEIAYSNELIIIRVDYVRKKNNCEDVFLSNSTISCNNEGKKDVTLNICEAK